MNALVTELRELVGDLNSHISSLDAPTDLRSDLSQIRTLSGEAVLACEQVCGYDLDKQLFQRMHQSRQPHDNLTTTSQQIITSSNVPQREVGGLCIRTKNNLEDAIRVVKVVKASGARKWYHKLRSKSSQDDLSEPIRELRERIDEAYHLQGTVFANPGNNPRPSTSDVGDMSPQPSSLSLGSGPSSPSLSALGRSRTQRSMSGAGEDSGGLMWGGGVDANRGGSLTAARSRAYRTSSGVGGAEQAPVCVIRDGKVFSEVCWVGGDCVVTTWQHQLLGIH